MDRDTQRSWVIPPLCTRICPCPFFEATPRAPPPGPRLKPGPVFVASGAVKNIKSPSLFALTSSPPPPPPPPRRLVLLRARIESQSKVGTTARAPVCPGWLTDSGCGRGSLMTSVTVVIPRCVCSRGRIFPWWLVRFRGAPLVPIAGVVGGMPLGDGAAALAFACCRLRPPKWGRWQRRASGGQRGRPGRLRSTFARENRRGG